MTAPARSRRMTFSATHVSPRYSAINCDVSRLPGGQQAREAHLDVRADRMPETPEFRRRDARLLPEAEPHGGLQLVADRGEPPHDRRPVHVVRAGDRIQAHAGYVVEAQQ